MFGFLGFVLFIFIVAFIEHIVTNEGTTKNNRNPSDAAKNPSTHSKLSDVNYLGRLAGVFQWS